MFFERALAALGHLSETPERLVQAIEVHIELRDWLMPLGELGRPGNYLEEAETIACRLADDRRRGVVIGHLGHYRWLVGAHG